MRIAVPRETRAGERRVALVPEVCAKLVSAGLEVRVESGAGEEAYFSDAAYEEGGVSIASSSAETVDGADVVVRVHRPETAELESLKSGAVLVSFLYPQENPELVAALAERHVTTFSMDAVPRITRAQGMDALSSMSTLAGYKAVLVGAAAHGRILPMLVTAAGTIRPAKALIIGAGVAGLQAIATARRLGAVAHAFDVRAAAKEQVESLGARFVSPDLGGETSEGTGGYARELSKDTQARNLEILHENMKDKDLVITTALIPGRPAPLLITRAMVEDMVSGAVIIDLAIEKGGNCEVSKADEPVRLGGVTVLAPSNLPSTIPTHASQMYSRNVAAFLRLIVVEGDLKLDFDDEIVRGMCITHAGEVRHDATRELLQAGSAEEDS